MDNSTERDERQGPASPQADVDHRRAVRPHTFTATGMRHSDPTEFTRFPDSSGAEFPAEHDAQQGYDDDDDDDGDGADGGRNRYQRYSNHTDTLPYAQGSRLRTVQRRISDGDLVLSDAMTLKARQEAINQSHPFGIRLWKPALYKKKRTIDQIYSRDVHESPEQPSRRSVWCDIYTNAGNAVWLIVFGWWMSLIYIAMAAFVYLATLTTHYGPRYAALFWHMAVYIAWPFGQFIERTALRIPMFNELHEQMDLWTHEAHGEQAPLLSAATSAYHSLDAALANNEEAGENDKSSTVSKLRRGASKGLSHLGRLGYSGIVYYIVLAVLLTPLHLIVSALCWLFVVAIPMAKVNFVVLKMMWKMPLALQFSSISSMSAHPHMSGEILLCTHRALAKEYYKYTVDGINIMFINLLPVVLFALVDGYILGPALHHEGIAHPMAVFCLCLTSVIPLAYFIGMAVASISSQSSFGLGAVINASFGSIVEIILYWIAISQAKAQLVEGAIIGSIVGSLLLLPGLSMIAGGVGKWKEQRFNVKSAGVSSVLLIMALIGAFTPTIFYAIFGKYVLTCDDCPAAAGTESDVANVPLRIMLQCSGCAMELPKNVGTDPFYKQHVRPLMFFCASILPFAYLIGLWFTLKTHVKQIYHVDATKKSPQSTSATPSTAILTAKQQQQEHQAPDSSPITGKLAAPHVAGTDTAEPAGGHDAPEWSKWKSSIILLVSTVTFSLLAELLVDSVDTVIASAGLDEKFVGLTLFALVPNVTEFVNAIAFAMYGNVALSLEIGSAYAVQVAMIQIPLLVILSAVWNSIHKLPEDLKRSFTLVFPRWDVCVVFFSVFLLSYTYIEGKANYFKGTILTLAYMVIVISFYFAPAAA